LFSIFFLLEMFGEEMLANHVVASSDYHPERK
jgi:hypothetical protein